MALDTDTVAGLSEKAIIFRTMRIVTLDAASTVKQIVLRHLVFERVRTGIL